MSLFLLLLYVALYVIMALIVWFDKRDGKSRWGRGADNDAAGSSAGNDGSSDSTSQAPKGIIDAFFETLAGEWP